MLILPDGLVVKGFGKDGYSGILEVNKMREEEILKRCIKGD